MSSFYEWKSFNNNERLPMNFDEWKANNQEVLNPVRLGGIMKLEDQVCSLEYAKELKELGVKQESLWYWIMTDREDIKNYWQLMCTTNPYTNIIKDWSDKNNKEWCASAFTVAELGEMLPRNILINDLKHQLSIKKLSNGWIVSYLSYLNMIRGETIREYAENEANARAKMLIHLIKKGIVKP